ncbi:MAG: PH domain-containing protein [Propionibacteriaceae bacterium]
MAAPLERLLDPKVTRHLIADEGEIVVDEVRRHWAAHAVPTLEVVAGLAIGISTLWWPIDLALIPLLLFLGLAGHGLYRIVAVHMDRFVITNMRVFRVHGIFSRHTATMPMARILDITVDKPLVGRMLGYGHFVFESAAQAQGLREIRYVGRPDERDLTIQRVIQRSGLRSSMRPTKEDQ